MRHVQFFSLVLCGVCCHLYDFPSPEKLASFEAVEEKQTEAKKLHGTWRIDALFICEEESGKKNAIFDDSKRMLVISTENKVRIEINSTRLVEWLAKYDMEKSPIWVDFEVKSAFVEKVEIKFQKGILKLDGDSLTIHVGANRRPTDFEQGKGLTSMLIKSTRIK